MKPKPLTESKLIELIKQVYLEAFNDLLSEEPALLAEPEFVGDIPTNLTESVKEPGLSHLIQILSKLEESERARLFRRFGYYTSQQLLQHLSNIKKAEKGNL